MCEGPAVSVWQRAGEASIKPALQNNNQSALCFALDLA